MQAAKQQRLPQPQATASNLSCYTCPPHAVLELSEDARGELAERLCHQAAAATWLPAALASIVGRASRRQALAGLITTGPMRSLSYVAAKMHKRVQSILRGATQ
jgi:hypothetical protein